MSRKFQSPKIHSQNIQCQHPGNQGEEIDPWTVRYRAMGRPLCWRPTPPTCDEPVRRSLCDELIISVSLVKISLLWAVYEQIQGFYNISMCSTFSMNIQHCNLIVTKLVLLIEEFQFMSSVLKNELDFWDGCILKAWNKWLKPIIFNLFIFSQSQ